MTTNVRKLATNRQAREHLKAQLAEYLTQQPESTRSVHKWMKRVEAAGLGVVVAAFCAALYCSFTWASTNPIMIPLAWFFFAACLSLMMSLLGLHTIFIRAFPLVILPGKAQRFVSGSMAVWIGVTSILGGLIMAGLWIAFAYSTAIFNLAMLVPLINALGIVVSTGIALSIAVAFYQKLIQSR